MLLLYKLRNSNFSKSPKDAGRDERQFWDKFNFFKFIIFPKN